MNTAQNLYRQFEKGIIWRKGVDEVCDACEEKIKSKIKELRG